VYARDWSRRGGGSRSSSEEDMSLSVRSEAICRGRGLSKTSSRPGRSLDCCGPLDPGASKSGGGRGGSVTWRGGGT